MKENFFHKNANETDLDNEFVTSYSNLYEKLNKLGKDFLIKYTFTKLSLYIFQNIIIKNIHEKISLCSYYSTLIDEPISSKSKVIIIAILKQLNIIENKIFEEFLLIIKQIFPKACNNIFNHLKINSETPFNFPLTNFSSSDIYFLKFINLFNLLTKQGLETNIKNLNI